VFTARYGLGLYSSLRFVKGQCSGKAVSFKYLCVFVLILALVIRHAQCMRRIVICGKSGPTVIFVHIVSLRRNLLNGVSK